MVSPVSTSSPSTGVPPGTMAFHVEHEPRWAVERVDGAWGFQLVVTAEWSDIWHQARERLGEDAEGQVEGMKSALRGWYERRAFEK